MVHASYGDSVFVVEDQQGRVGRDDERPDGKPAKVARQQFVRLGVARGDFVAVVDGVKAGQELVTAGAFKLRNGGGIVVNNDIKPTPSLRRTSTTSRAAMRFTDIFIRRPVLAIVVNLVIIIAGLQAVRSLNVRQYPRLESATVTVRTVYVGASADLVRGFITTPLERAIAAADGIDYIESQSDAGAVDHQRAPQAQLQRRRRARRHHRARQPGARRSAARGRGPVDQHRAVRLGVRRRCTSSFSSTILEDNQVTDYLIRVVQPRLSAIDGVQRADILGGRTFAIRAWLKPDRMAALNVSPAQVRAGARPPTTTSPPSGRPRVSSCSST